MAVLVGIHTNHKSTHPFSLARGRDQHLLGPGLDVLTGTGLVNKYPGGFNHQIHTPFLPGQVEGVTVGKTFN